MRCLLFTLLFVVPLVVSDVSAVEELKACQSEEELRKVFRRLALDLHPDRASSSASASPAEAADIFAAVRGIYEALLASFDGNKANGDGTVPGSDWERQWNEQCMNAARAVAAVGASRHSSLGFSISQGIHGSTGPGPVMEKLNLTYAQVMRGATLPYALDRLTPCSSCAGRGHEPVPGHDPCPACGGEGYRLGGRKMRAGGPSLETEGDPSHSAGDPEGPHHAVQYTCAACCGSGVGMRACPACKGTGWTRRRVNGTLQVRGGLGEKDILEVKKVWSPVTPQGEDEGEQQEEAWQEWKIQPSHLQVAHDTSWESTRGFLLLPPSLVRVSRMSLLHYCKRQSVRLTLPTGITHTLPLGGGGVEGNGTRPLASVQALRVSGGGIPYEASPGLHITGDALLVLRLSFPDRIGGAEAGILAECYGTRGGVQLGLLRYTAHALASLYAGWVEHREGCPVEALGLLCTTPSSDPLTTALHAVPASRGGGRRNHAYWFWAGARAE